MLLTLLGVPVLVHTLRRFQDSPLVDGFILSAPAGEEDGYRQLCAGHRFSKLLDVVAGGAERQDSIRNALQVLRAEAQDAVAIHDGARPFFPLTVLESGRTALEDWDGALPMTAVKDTIKRVDDSGRVLVTLVRGELFAAQTPQFFRFGAIHDAHLAAHAAGFLGTDDASLIEWRGGSVTRLEGDYRNIKITTPEDLQVAETWLKEDARVPLRG